MDEQIDLFEIQKYYGYAMERHGRKIKAWIVPYCKDSEWAGAWYKDEMKAIKFVAYLNAKNGGKNAENHSEADRLESMGSKGDS